MTQEKAQIIADIRSMVETARACKTGGWIFVWDLDLAVKIADGKPLAVSPMHATTFPAGSDCRFINGREEVAVLMDRQAALARYITRTEALIAEFSKE